MGVSLLQDPSEVTFVVRAKRPQYLPVSRRIRCLEQSSRRALRAICSGSSSAPSCSSSRCTWCSRVMAT